MALTYLELLLARARRRFRYVRSALTIQPMMGGEDPPDPDPDPKDPDPKDPEPDPEPVTTDDDWKTKARKHENAAKSERKKREEAERKLKERDDADKSEHEKAIEKAREEARAEALTEADKERRADKLELNVTRLSAKGFDIEVKDGDETKTETAKFADPDDAIVHVERAISKGDLDADDIFDDEGKVKTEALTEALKEILERKPHLRGSQNGDAPRPKGGAADAGKGSGGAKGLEEMTPAEHAERKYGDAKSHTVEPPARTRR